jgi:hypothetical protein
MKKRLENLKLSKRYEGNLVKNTEGPLNIFKLQLSNE